ncbi:2-hydroxyacid dehydrogenase [Porcincola intestinalis]|jgi:D-lactate dehydrogenase|uniref:2-hydroxyacid dehydrogenase n=1 Tax=Porcincola intestinalis TaxID=2606632 RepID=A0A6L5X8M9_9FIRM|nr:2-hydroxyacid dehydrogenase [Porcincola intestinalis]MCI6239381.1 2-hydroxyacid dehydrogenase [Lachnospiraceae bacterium]MCI6699606.1 2-hydroxyacid dehydrogenase [Lachnospiraceae bacterium]MCI6767049.1 2-hydroxyacid dehydrogenase [Lachnospiraceae bacterium]MCI7094019.1 2-hydroxyacid dehydrogenase [Lachnospiraceae bacterium]MDD7059241.1 2-hydroxyacid dehydrogenase [Porcincola intestinalis]
MRITFFDAKSYDTESFDAIKANYPDLELEYWEAELNPKTAAYVTDSEAVCAFVNANAGADTLRVLASRGVKLLLMRCAGYNNVDLEAATANGIKVMRVPGYSPEAVAELAMTLASAVNRHIHKAYIRVRENNFSLQGLTGKNFYGKTAGIIGTGKIGAAMARICRGYGMRVLGYDKYPNKSLDFVEYVSLEQLLRESDLISLHCPLMKETYHMINIFTINQMKDGVILVNTSRGGLIDTNDLIQGIRERKFSGVGLDVYEEEKDNVFENHEDDIMMHSVTSRLLSFPNVIVTSHQGFFTEEALAAIAETTLGNAEAYLKGEKAGTELN